MNSNNNSMMILSNFMFGENIDIYSKIVYMTLKKYINKDTNSCFVSKKRLIEECGISMSTLNKALKNLVESGVLKKEYRYRQNNSQTSNLYTLTQFLTSGDYYFTVRKDIFDLDLKAKEIVVYAYLCSAANKDMESHPSIKEIALHCSISETTVKNVLKELISKNLIEKVNQYRDDGGKRNNSYRIIKEENKADCKDVIIDELNLVENSIEEFLPESDIIASIVCEHADEEKQLNKIEHIYCTNNLYKKIGQDLLYNHIVRKLFFNHSIVKIIKRNKPKSKKLREELRKMRRTKRNKNKTDNMKIRDDIFSFKLSEISLLIYLYINSKSSENEPCFPSVDEICKKIKISSEIVQQSLDELELKGLIVRQIYVLDEDVGA